MICRVLAPPPRRLLLCPHGPPGAPTADQVPADDDYMSVYLDNLEAEWCPGGLAPAACMTFTPVKQTEEGAHWQKGKRGGTGRGASSPRFYILQLVALLLGLELPGRSFRGRMRGHWDWGARVGGGGWEGRQDRKGGASSLISGILLSFV